MSNNILRKNAAGGLFGHIFRGVFVVAMLCVLFVWSWLNSRFYHTLDQEADQRLKRIATILVTDLQNLNSDDRSEMQTRAMGAFWQLEKTGGLLQNLYWLDVSADVPEFIASYSAQHESSPQMLPPSAEEVEDLVFDHINELDHGEMVSPDPYAYGVNRRFKILLCPVVNASGMLASVIGIESDMEYLDLVIRFRRFLAEGIVVAILLSLAVAYFLARNLAGKIESLSYCVKRIEAGQHLEPQSLGLLELDELYLSFITLAKELGKQKEHVQQVFNRKLDELAFTGGAIAHEIRNPLSAIEMHFGLLRRELSGSVVADSAAIAEISQQLQHLRQLLENFLRYTRKVQPKPEPIVLREFIERLLSSRKMLNENFAATVAMDADLVVCFDPTMLQQILENLLNNSLFAASQKAVVITITAALSRQKLVLTFGDNGPGVAAEIRPQLFTPFATGNEQGSGFGLALIHKLIEAHGGEISYSNGDNGGAVFTIEVPQYENTCS